MKCKAGIKCSPTGSSDDYEKLKHFPADGQVDIMTVQDLLDAAGPVHVTQNKTGLDLDELSDACPDKCSGYNSTYRYVGVMLTLTLLYDNTGLLIGDSDNDWGIGLGDTKYQIRVTTEESTTFNVQVTQHNGVNTNRTIHHIHGLRFLVTQTGNVGDWDFNTILLQATTSVAILAFATVIVDVLLQHFLPDSDRYRKHKFETVEKIEGEHSILGALLGTATLGFVDVDQGRDSVQEQPEIEDYVPGVRDEDTAKF